MGKGKVLVVDDTKLICKMIHDKLVASGYDVTEAYDGPEGVKKAKSFEPDVIVLDVMLPGMDGYEVARTLRKDPQGAATPILMLTAKSGIQEKIAGFESGADDYLTKPFDPTELELRIRALLARSKASREAAPATAAAGLVLAVFSLRGGSGTSSLAVNLAASLAQTFESQVPLIDLALETGSNSLMLDLIPKMTLSNLAKEDPGTIDDDLIGQYFIAHASGVRLLAAPASPALAELVTPKLMHQVLPVLKQAYPVSVVDLPHNLGELTLSVLDQSDTIVLVVPPDMISLKAASSALETFSSLGYLRERVRIVINWVFPRRGLRQEEIEGALGGPALVILPYELDSLIRAINEGAPAVLATPNTPWSLKVEELAFRLAPDSEKARAETAGLKRYALLRKRVTGS